MSACLALDLLAGCGGKRVDLPGGAGGAGTGGITGVGGALPALGGRSGAGGGSATGGAPGTGGSAPSPPSCAGLGATCGPNGTSDCCASGQVTGGTFARNHSQGTTATATVSDFRLDTYEISVSRFRNFVAGYPGNMPAAGSGKNPHNPADPGWDVTWNGAGYLPADQAALIAGVQCAANYQTWTAGNDSLPMNCITWYEAYAFCIWDGGRLPTDAEANYAAVGGAEQRYYPWSMPPNSMTIDGSYAVYSVNGIPGPARVGSKSPKGDGKWGQADLAGNLWEWLQDGDDSLSPIYPASCVDCADLSGTAYRFNRGGGFLDAATVIDTYFGPGHTAPTTRYTNFGARCARSAL